MKNVTLALAALALLLGGVGQAKAGVIAPSDPVSGVSQSTLADQWWSWALSYPTPTNPIVDPTGQFSSAGNQGSVFFLAGGFTFPLTRTVTVLDNQPLFFPLVTAVIVPDASAYGPDEAGLRKDVLNELGIVSGLFVTLDGNPVVLPLSSPDLLDFYQTSASEFTLNLPPDNLFGLPAGSYQAIQAGYYVALGPLSPGSHTLEFGGIATGTGAYAGGVNQQDVTYDINSVPEPATMTLLGFGVAGLAGYGWRRRKQIVPA